MSPPKDTLLRVSIKNLISFLAIVGNGWQVRRTTPRSGGSFHKFLNLSDDIEWIYNDYKFFDDGSRLLDSDAVSQRRLKLLNQAA